MTFIVISNIMKLSHNLYNPVLLCNIFYVRNGSCNMKIMLCICSLFLKYRKLCRIFLENFKNSTLKIFVPLTVIENICFYPTLVNFILFRQMAYQLI